MKTTTLKHISCIGIIAMQITSLILTGIHLAVHEWAWALNYFGNFLLWSLVLMLSLERDIYLRKLRKTLDFLEELRKAGEEKAPKDGE